MRVNCLRSVVLASLIVVACFGRCHAAARWSQLATPVFQHVVADAGPPNLSTSLAIDGDGFLWVGSFAGLARWDGYRLHTYAPKQGDPAALPDNVIQALHADQAGRLWAGTNSHGLLRYDRDSDRFVPIPPGLSHVSVLSLCNDGKGGLWVGTDAGLDQLDLEAATGKVLRIRHDAVSTSLPDPHVRAIVAARDGTLWLGSDKGLFKRTAGARLGQVMLPLPLQPEVGALAEDSAGRIWVGTRGHGAFVLQNGTALPIAVQEPTLPAESVYAIAEARPGQVWLATFGQGIVTVDAASGETRRLRHDPALSASLIHDSVWALLRDRAGLMWAATGGGLSWHDPQQDAVLSVFGAASLDHGGLRGTEVFSVLSMPSGRLWLGLGSQGIDIVDPSAQRVGSIESDATQPEQALPRDRVVSMAAGANRVYAATPRGAYKVDVASAQESRPGNVARLPLPAPGPAIRINTVSVAGQQLWIGSRDNGLWLQSADGSLRRVGAAGGRALVDQRITAIAPDEHGKLWIGTRNGLDRIDPATMDIEHSALPPSYVTSLLTDLNGRLWVGTYGGGITILDQGKANMVANLPSANISMLLADRDGHVWASTDNGIARVDGDSMAVRKLHRAEGVAITNAWIGSGAVSKEGELLFGGLGGLTVIRPELLRTWTFKPPLALTDVRLGGKRVPAGRYRPGTAMTVEANANSVAVEFSALDYSAPQSNRYAYRLDGFDRDWTETDATRRLAAYTNLPPGQYTLLLRASNRSGDWSDAELALPIVVLPAWYQTLWWQVLVVLLAAALVAGFVRLRTARLRRHKRELEQEVARQTAALREHQARMVQQEKLASLGGLVAGMAHGVNTPLGTVVNAISGASEVLQELNAAVESGKVNKSLLVRMLASASEFTGLALRNATRAADLVDSFKSMVTQRDVETAEMLDLSVYLPQVSTLVRRQLEQHGHRVLIDVPAPLKVRVVTDALNEVMTRVLANVEDHAFDDGRHGTLRISARKLDDGKAEIVVADDGQGIAQHDIARVFDPFFTTRSGSGNHVGLGLNVAFNHVTERLKGTITVTSPPGGGTTVTIVF